MRALRGRQMLGDTGAAAAGAGGEVPVKEPYAALPEIDRSRRGEDDRAPGARRATELRVGHGGQVREWQ
jgi:hypothetical protein